MPTKPKTTTATAGPPIKVLVIDNDPAHAEAMADSLRSVGFDCTVATTGPEGAALLGRRFVRDRDHGPQDAGDGRARDPGASARKCSRTPK